MLSGFHSKPFLDLDLETFLGELFLKLQPLLCSWWMGLESITYHTHTKKVPGYVQSTSTFCGFVPSE